MYTADLIQFQRGAEERFYATDVNLFRYSLLKYPLVAFDFW